MKVRLSLSALVAVAAALSFSLSAGAANRPGDYYAKQPGSNTWTSVGTHPGGTKWWSRPNASAGWTRAAT
jgi:hypothetical protein